MADGGSTVPARIPPDRVVHIDVFNDPRFADDPYATISELHKSPFPVLWTTANGGHWIVTGYDQTRDMWQRHEMFASKYLRIPPPTYNRASQLPVTVDPPLHTRYRRVLNPIFAPSAVGDFEGRSRAVVRELLGGFARRGEADLLEALAIPMPVTIFISWLGLPVERHKDFIEWKDEFFRNPDVKAKDAAIEKIEAEMQGLIDKRRAEPADDIISKVVQAEPEGGPWETDELLSLGFLLFIAGLDTMTMTMAYMLEHLAKNPGQRQRLIENPSLIPDAVEELLRRYPVVNPVRTATGDFEWEGVQIREGDQFFVGSVLANLDPHEYPHALDVDFSRSPNPHLTFAAGPHRCAGSHLARIELRVMLEEALPLLENLRIKPGATIEHYFGVLCGMKELPCVWDVIDPVRPRPTERMA